MSPRILFLALLAVPIFLVLAMLIFLGMAGLVFLVLAGLVFLVMFALIIRLYKRRLPNNILVIEEKTFAARARASWLCPMMAWLSQFVIVFVLYRISGLEIGKVIDEMLRGAPILTSFLLIPGLGALMLSVIDPMGNGPCCLAGFGALWLTAMLTQSVLIIAGLCIGVTVLLRGRSSVPPSNWRAAVAGVLLSGGTILLIGGLLVAALWKLRNFRIP